MAKGKGDGDAHQEVSGPADFTSPALRMELKRALVWIGAFLAVAGTIFLAQPLMLIIGGLVFAVILDGGTRLLGRFLPIPRGIRLAIVSLLGFGFIGWTIWYAGTTFAEQAGELRETVTGQFNELLGFARSTGLIDETSWQSVSSNLLGGVGRLTSAIGSALGAITALVMITVIGLFIASEPKLYDRGVAWMLPVRHRSNFYEVMSKVGYTLRRLMAGRIFGMAFEGVFTWALLSLIGVPMAALLGLITGLMAFLPNIGSIISGVLIIAVGFSAGTETGIWAIVAYMFVQQLDSYLVVPYIARRTVDLAPAVVLAAQLVFGALFGILGLILADPIVCTIKVALEEYSRLKRERATGGAATEPAPA